MSDGWYYAMGESAVGPVTLDELRDALKRQANAARALVWKDGFADWVEASTVAQLARAVAAPPPLPPERAIKPEPTPPPAQDVVPAEHRSGRDIPLTEQRDQQVISVPPLFSFRGRFNRVQYAVTVFGVLILVLAFGAVGGSWQSSLSPLFGAMVGLTAVWVHFAAAAKRFHDMNRTGYSVLYLAFPVINLFTALILFFCPGDEGTNQFGPPT